MPEALTRTGIVVPLADKSDLVKPVDVLRTLGAFFDANVLMVSQGLLSARPAAGKYGRFYRAMDDPSSPIVYYDDGTQWSSIGATAPADGVAATPSLRTLGSGAQQAASGTHSHGIGAIVGAGGAASLNVGTTTGTVAAGDDSRFGTTTANDTYVLALMGAL